MLGIASLTRVYSVATPLPSTDLMPSCTQRWLMWPDTPTASKVITCTKNTVGTSLLGTKDGTADSGLCSCCC